MFDLSSPPITHSLGRSGPHYFPPTQPLFFIRACGVIRVCHWYFPPTAGLCGLVGMLVVLGAGMLYLLSDVEAPVMALGRPFVRRATAGRL